MNDDNLAYARRRYDQANDSTGTSRGQAVIVIQPKLEVPAKIAVGIASGKFVLIGGVVRNGHSGRVVTFLKEAPVAKNGQEAMEHGAAIMRFRATVVTTALGTLAAGTTAFVILRKRKQTGKREMAECVGNLNVSLRTYLRAGHEGSLDASIIDRLISDLDAVEVHSDSASVPVNFSSELWEALANFVIDHTQRLAEAYSTEFEELPGQALVSRKDIVDLRHYLDIQRQIFTEAA